MFRSPVKSDGKEAKISCQNKKQESKLGRSGDLELIARSYVS
jgi:hypothetical protein